jgi:hypothetical protein
MQSSSPPCVLHALTISSSLTSSSWNSPLGNFLPPPTVSSFFDQKYSPQHPVLKYPRSTFLPQCQGPSFTPIQNYKGGGGTRKRSCLRHYATSRKVAGSIPDKVNGIFNWPDPTSRKMALGSTRPIIKTSTRNLPGGKGRPARKADNLTAICEPTVKKMWKPQCLTALWASTACYRDSFTFTNLQEKSYSFVYFNLYAFRQQMRKQNVINWMVAFITRIHLLLSSSRIKFWFGTSQLFSRVV